MRLVTSTDSRKSTCLVRIAGSFSGSASASTSSIILPNFCRSLGLGSGSDASNGSEEDCEDDADADGSEDPDAESNWAYSTGETKFAKGSSTPPPADSTSPTGTCFLGRFAFFRADRPGCCLLASSDVLDEVALRAGSDGAREDAL